MEIYVHIPFCERKCYYCDFLSGAADADTRQAYVDALTKEIRERARTFGRDNKVTSVYFGGGTPSVLSAEQLESLYSVIGQEFNIDSNAEITIEVNPKSGRGKSEALRRIGFNRLSIGMQSSHISELELLGRIHTYDDFTECYREARDAGFRNINVDIMTAVPGQTQQMLAATIDKVMELSPEHISAYSLIIEKGTPFYERFGDIEGPVVGEEAERKLYWMTVDMLKDNGYRHYEISNFARPGFESRHNTGYWKREHYLGLGLGASSCLADKDIDVRTRNTTDLAAYINDPLAMEEYNVLTRDEMIEETMYLGLRMTDGVDTDEFEKTFGVTVRSLYGNIIDDLVVQGLVYEGAGSLSLTDLGIDYGNYVFSRFVK